MISGDIHTIEGDDSIAFLEKMGFDTAAMSREEVERLAGVQADTRGSLTHATLTSDADIARAFMENP